ncbi:MAG: NAD(P)H-hydrate epimerase [Phycisphaerae bacterium]
MSRDETPITLTRAQVREVDRRAIEDYGMPGIILMENAGRNAARIIRGLLEERGDSPPPGCPVAIVCGRGNNGGDGFVIARHLTNLGYPVACLLACAPERLTGDAATQSAIATKMGVPCNRCDNKEGLSEIDARLQDARVVVDALLGTGFAGRVRAPLDALIESINRARPALIAAIDVPSGLDCDTGRPSNATVRADATITFVANKTGFLQAGAAAYTGRVIVTDIGAPVQIIRDVHAGASG